jgi:hypothetical protein
MTASFYSDAMFHSYCNDAAVIVQAHATQRREHPAIFQLHKDWSGVRDLRDFNRRFSLPLCPRFFVQSFDIQCAHSDHC